MLQDLKLEMAAINTLDMLIYLLVIISNIASN